MTLDEAKFAVDVINECSGRKDAVKESLKILKRAKQLRRTSFLSEALFTARAEWLKAFVEGRGEG